MTPLERAAAAWNKLPATDRVRQVEGLVSALKRNVRRRRRRALSTTRLKSRWATGLVALSDSDRAEARALRRALALLKAADAEPD